MPTNQVAPTFTPPAQATTWQVSALVTSPLQTPSTLSTWWWSSTSPTMSPSSWFLLSPLSSSSLLWYGPSVKIQGMSASRNLIGWKTTWLRTIISMRWPLFLWSDHIIFLWGDHIIFLWGDHYFYEVTSPSLSLKLPSYNWLFQVIVQTGNMLSHGTESKVEMILTGEENATQVRTLSDPKKPRLFKKGCLDAFLMSVDKPLGHLQYLQVTKTFSQIYWITDKSFLNMKLCFLLYSLAGKHKMLSKLATQSFNILRLIARNPNFFATKSTIF